MGELIAFRALQGIGGGGLMIGAQTIVGDVVPPRDRGRYQGLFGAVFGVTSVLGPLVGGLLVDHASWRWVFYINLPLGVVALLVTGAFLPAAQRRVSHIIDYLGATLVAAGTTCLVLMTSLGRDDLRLGIAADRGPRLWPASPCSRCSWPSSGAPRSRSCRCACSRTGSSQSAARSVSSSASRCSAPSRSCPSISRSSRGSTPTVSGLRLLPLMVGLLLTSVASGQLISRTGHYKIFPIVGTALMTIGLLLLSRLGPDTSWLDASLYMFVFGMGLGSVMQVTVIATQNAVDHNDLGAATSGVTYFRSMGGSFGTAVFGSIFSNRLTANIALLPRRDGAAGGRQQRDAEPRAR